MQQDSRRKRAANRVCLRQTWQGYFLRVLSWSSLDIRELKQWRRRRQRKHQKSSSLDRQNNNLARASRFFVHFFAVVSQQDVNVPNFMFCGGREHKTTTFVFFSWTSIRRLEFNSRQIRQHFVYWTSWNRRDKVWSSTNSIFKWVFW